jgi:hypothetical protein
MDTLAAENQQDWLRGIRGFVNIAAGVVNDQSWAGQDGRAYNSPYGYQSIGAPGTGYAVEGRPISVTPSGGVAVSNGTLMLILGAAAVFLFMK